MRKLLFILPVLLWSLYSLGGGGTSSLVKSITLHPGVALEYSLGMKADSVIAVFKIWMSIDESDTLLPDQMFVKGPNIVMSKQRFNNYFSVETVNRDVIRTLDRLEKIEFFRVYFKDVNGRIYKYVDVSPSHKKLTEVALLPDGNLEQFSFYPSGSIFRRCNYIILPQDPKDESSTKWFGLSPLLSKDGKEEIYYETETLRARYYYKKGKLADSSYTEYYPNGKILRSFSIKANTITSYQWFDEQAKPIKNFENRKAFLWAVSKFEPKKNNKFAEISSENDLVYLKNLLFSTCGFSEKSSVTALNPTKAQTMEAFRSYIEKLQPGDNALIHFSGHGVYQAGFSEEYNSYNGIYLPCYDGGDQVGNLSPKSNVIFERELQDFFNQAKDKVGSSGQVIISMDVGGSGYLLSFVKQDSIQVAGNTKRGETNNVLYNIWNQSSVPVTIFTACLKGEYNFETTDDEGKALGSYTYAFFKALPFAASPIDLAESIKNIMRERRVPQTPGFVTNNSLGLFETKKTADASLPPLTITGDTYMLSIGISNYPKYGGLSFTNCAEDAKSFSSFFSSQFEDSRLAEKRKFNSFLLLDSSATRKNILAAINQILSNSKPGDYFIFNFSGYCRPLKDSSGRQVTYFIPYGLSDIGDSTTIIKEGISLKDLKDLFQLIPANNQLFITEAGSTEKFKGEFIQALVETSPTIAALSSQNRIFILPNGSGFDKFTCNGSTRQQGPINYFVTSLDKRLNIYGIFQEGIYANAINYALSGAAVKCNFISTAYFDIFFEKSYIQSLRDFLPEEMMRTRGGATMAAEQEKVAGGIAKKYALLIGNNAYSGKPDWGDLDGVPSKDVEDIATELEKNYGFEVKKIIDATADSIYQQVFNFSRILKSTDQLLIYVAGHGDFDEKFFDDGFIVCSNSLPVKQDPYRYTYIQYSKLSRMINRLPSRQIFMVLDVCFGGTFDERIARNKSRSITSDYEELGADVYLSEKLKFNTRLYLSSGGKREVPNGYKGSHSPFAQCFIRCLQGRGGSGKLITSTDFYQFVKKLPSGPLLGSFGDDEPGSEFIMLAK